MNNVAVKDIKTVNGEITKLENELVVVREEVEKTKRTKEDLQALIEKKTSDFNVYIAQQDADNKRDRAAVTAEREKLKAEQAEFQEILIAHKDEKAALENSRREFDIQRLKFETMKQNVQEYITAVRRASGLLGI